MATQRRSLLVVSLLIVSSVLSSSLLIPGVRPFMAWAVPGSDDAVHSFMALGLLGGTLSSPLVARQAHRLRDPSRAAALLAALDALFLAAFLARPPLAWLLCFRFLQGATGLAALSLLLGAAPIAEQRRGSSAGILGAAVMLGVALGAPLGTLSLWLGPTGPIVVAVALEGVVAASVLFVRLAPTTRDATRSGSLPWLPMAWVFAERLAIGLFVVTFALHARGCLEASDSRLGALLTAFMVTFVVFVYPAGALSDRVGSARLAAPALLGYGLAWLALPSAHGAGVLSLLMFVLGVSSACVYAAAMRRATLSSGSGSRIAAMSGLNAAGALGMLCGTALAGILSAALRSSGAPPHSAHALVLALAGWFQISAGLATAAVVLIAQRHARLMRS